MKLKAVQKYESPKKMEEPKMMFDKKDYMKYELSFRETFTEYSAALTKVNW